MQITFDETVASRCALGTEMGRPLGLEVVVVVVFIVKDSLSSQGHGRYGFWREEEVWGRCFALRFRVRVWRRNALGEHGRVLVHVRGIYLCVVDVRL
jgi:hypothetical protein